MNEKNSEKTIIAAAIAGGLFVGMIALRMAKAVVLIGQATFEAVKKTKKS